MGFFTPFNFATLCQFYSTTYSASFSKLHKETKEWEGKRFFAYMATLAYDAFINNQHQQSSGILIFLCKYYIVISDTLVDTFLNGSFLLLAVILSELPEKPKRKDWVTKKKIHRSICVRNITLLTARSPFYVFLLLPLSTLSPFPSNTLAEWLL